jgi:hypothetical protein
VSWVNLYGKEKNPCFEVLRKREKFYFAADAQFLIFRFIRHNIQAQGRVIDAATFTRVLPAPVFCAPGQDIRHVIAPSTNSIFCLL